MKALYGADSAIPANTRLTNGYTLYEWVARMSGFPAFWGRTLTGVNAVEEGEAEFLRRMDCKIALIYDELSEIGVSSNDGARDTVRAVEAAKGLGVPQGQDIGIFAEIRPDWSVNHNWMISWANIMTNSGFIPGFIGNTDSSKNFNFGRQCSHYVQFMGAGSALYWATEPNLGAEPLSWSPYCPSALAPGQMHLWRAGGTVSYRDLQVNVDYARDASVLRSMWRAGKGDRVEGQCEEDG